MEHATNHRKIADNSEVYVKQDAIRDNKGRFSLDANADGRLMAAILSGSMYRAQIHTRLSHDKQSTAVPKSGWQWDVGSGARNLIGL